MRLLAAFAAGLLVGLAAIFGTSREGPPKDQHGQVHGTARSSKWPAVERAFKAKHPTCEVCGSDKNVEIHHRVPFYVDPSKELDFGNLVTLCSNSSCMSHLTIGHLGNYQLSNPHIREDADLIHRRRVEARRGKP